MGKMALGFMAAALCVAALAGCYGTGTGKQCEVCASLQEGKADGDEWTGQYINEQVKCKLEAGTLMVEHGDEWKACS